MKIFRNITIIIYCNNNICFRIFMKYLFCNIGTIFFSECLKFRLSFFFYIKFNQIKSFLYCKTISLVIKIILVQFLYIKCVWKAK